jgi:hypothetical protein
VLPTVVDVGRYPAPEPGAGRSGDPVAVWIGSKSTLAFLEEIVPALEEAARTVKGLRLRVISDAYPAREPSSPLPVDEVPFREETEASDLAGGTVGLAPLADDRWTRGKCGLKLLQYFAAGVPAVASPVGVQAALVTDGETGRIASTPDEWARCIAELARDPQLRIGLAKAARSRVEREFSLDVWADRWVAEVTGREAAGS